MLVAYGTVSLWSLFLVWQLAALWRITIILGALQGGQVPNLVFAEAHAQIDIRYLPEFDDGRCVRWSATP
jgi:hypothetical protein